MVDQMQQATINALPRWDAAKVFAIREHVQIILVSCSVGVACAAIGTLPPLEPRRPCALDAGFFCRFLHLTSFCNLPVAVRFVCSKAARVGGTASWLCGWLKAGRGPLPDRTGWQCEAPAATHHRRASAGGSSLVSMVLGPGEENTPPPKSASEPSAQ